MRSRILPPPTLANIIAAVAVTAVVDVIKAAAEASMEASRLALRGSISLIEFSRRIRNKALWRSACCIVRLRGYQPAVVDAAGCPR